MSIRSKPSVMRQDADCFTIVMISDTHELHREVDVPSGDLLIHAGDFTMGSVSAEKLLDFNEWLSELPHTFRLVIPGNHDFVVEDPARRELITNATLLVNEGVAIMGLKIWGSPVTPLFGEAFGVASERDRAKLYSRIPADTDVLVTRGPPSASSTRLAAPIITQVARSFLKQCAVSSRCSISLGHVHGGYGTLSTADILFVNAALPGEGFGMSKPPHVFRLRRR